MPNRLAVTNPTFVPDGEQGDFVVEVYEAFDNDLACTGSAAGLGILPGSLNIIFTAYGALTFAG